MKSVTDYIQAHWDECIKHNPEDAGTLIGLPRSYTVPAVGHFDEMYYWDTYFTNVGLMLSGRFDQAKNNVDNMIYLVNRYGFMPNGNRTYYLDRSQPPFLSQMVREAYEHTPDCAWLAEAYAALEKEYRFWLTQRTLPNGLAHYSGEVLPQNVIAYSESFRNRVKLPVPLPDEAVAQHFIASAESGWDMNPRWGFSCQTHASVDLNALLYLLEANMAFFAAELDNGNAEEWQSHADRRRERMTRFLQDGRGLLVDYDTLTGQHSKIVSAASLYPLFAGLATQEQAEAVVRNLPLLEADWGVLTCAKHDEPGEYQWDYPNGWACLQYVAVRGLANYGYHAEARRIAEKYVKLVEKVFDQTHNLWEKYNVAEGSINVTNEYGLPPMMGWSAGVYLACMHLLKREA